MLELPLHLLYDILCRLTVETIFSCKCVCKTFLEILTDPHFIEVHLTKAPDIDDGLILQDRMNISNFLLAYSNRFEPERPDSDHAVFNSRPCQTLAMPAAVSQLYNRSVYIAGACNGLLCLCYMSCSFHKIVYICNPILGEFFALPPVVEYGIAEFSGFGFCTNTKQYKVIRLVNYETCMIYTLGTDHNWRKIDNLPFPRCPGAFGSSLNGNLHWITNGKTASNLICSFNLATEQFSYVSPPTNFNQGIFTEFSPVNIGLLDGLLCFSYMLGSLYEAFVMKDYGVRGFWTKEFSIDLCSNFKLRERSINLVVKLLNNGDLFLQCDIYSLVCFSLRKGTTRNMLAEKVSCFHVLSFVPSFISVKDIVGAAGGNLEVVQRKMGRNLWSDNGFRFIR